MIVYDNTVSEETQNYIENLLTSTEFPWYFSEYTVETQTISSYETVKKDDLKVKEYLQFTHGFYRQWPLFVSPEYKKIKFLFDEFIKNTQIKVDDLIRVKANLQTQFLESNTEFYNSPHRDQPINHMVAIYYVNDSDGDTYIFEDEKIIKTITPVKGRFLVFNGKYFHAGRHPKFSSKRIVINFNFLQSENFQIQGD